MILDTRNAEAISRMVADKDWNHMGNYRFKDATLSGLIELGRLVRFNGQGAEAIARQMLIELPQATEWLKQIILHFQEGVPSPVERDRLYSAPEKELWVIKSPECLQSNNFMLYLQRFERRLRNSGFSDRYPKLLSSALLEITENIVRHSGDGESAPLGVIGFHVTAGCMNYVAADLGRGVLASLREKPIYSDIQDDSDALVAAARDGATRIKAQDSGDGFRRVFKAFLDREGILLMRSGAGKATITGNITHRSAEKSYDESVKGLRVSGLCSITGEAKEINFGH